MWNCIKYTCVKGKVVTNELLNVRVIVKAIVVAVDEEVRAILIVLSFGLIWGVSKGINKEKRNRIHL